MRTWWFMTTVHHDPDITWLALWPRHGDNNEDIANPASLMVYKNILNSLLLNLRIFKFMNILMPAGALRVWNIYKWSRDPAIFMARGCAGWVVWTHREWGWVIESYQGSSRSASCLAHCSTAATLTCRVCRVHIISRPQRNILWQQISRLHYKVKVLHSASSL